MDHAQHMHQLIGQAIEQHLKSTTSIHICHVEKNLPCNYQHMLDFSPVWKKYPGSVNHYDSTGNQIVFDQLCNKIVEITQ
jgi:hypothetical protein